MRPLEVMLSKVEGVVRRAWDSGQLTADMTYLLRDLEECLIPPCCHHPWSGHGPQGCSWRGEDENCRCAEVRDTE